MEKIISKKNILLQKDDVGKGKPCTIKLPPVDFVFGRPMNKDNESAGTLTTSWSIHQISQPRMTAKDFIRINKFGVSLKDKNIKVFNLIFSFTI